MEGERKELREREEKRGRRVSNVVEREREGGESENYLYMRARARAHGQSDLLSRAAAGWQIREREWSGPIHTHTSARLGCGGNSDTHLCRCKDRSAR